MYTGRGKIPLNHRIFSGLFNRWCADLLFLFFSFVPGVHRIGIPSEKVDLHKLYWVEAEGAKNLSGINSFGSDACETRSPSRAESSHTERRGEAHCPFQPLCIFLDRTNVQSYTTLKSVTAADTESAPDGQPGCRG
jgi:hypothetical protein